MDKSDACKTRAAAMREMSENEFVIGYVEPAVEFATYFFEIGDPFEAERCVEITACEVVAGDAGYKSVCAGPAAGRNQRLHKKTSDATAPVFRIDVYSGFPANAVCFASFPGMGVAETDNFPLIFIYKIGA